jgi:plastocyanin
MNTIKTRLALAGLALVAVGAPAAAVVSPLAQAGSGPRPPAGLGPSSPAGSGPSPPAGSPAAVARGASAHTVVLKGLRFHPSAVTVNPGESVTWVWQDGAIEHNVTARGFHSRTQTRGTFTVRFTHAGTFSYHCTIHEGMVGKVIVR